MFLALLSIAAGIIMGCVTGIVPGLHINTVAVVALSLYYSVAIEPVMLSVFIVAMAVTHSFVDFVPSVFLGVPDSANVLSVQPAHRMVLKGKGMDALFLSVLGGVFGILALAALVVPVFFLVPLVYEAVRGIVPLLLVATVLYMVAIERNVLYGAFVAAVSSFYGIVMMQPDIVSADNTLFLMLSGLFGISTLVLSVFTVSVFPRQRVRFRAKAGESFHGAVLGLLGGVVAGIMPGLGSSQAAIVVQRLFRTNGMRPFIVLLGCINTIDIVMSVLSLYLIGRARSGSAIVISEVLEVDVYYVALFFGVALFSAGAASYLTMCIGRVFAGNMQRINYRRLVVSVIVFLFAMVFFYEGVFGVLVCATGAFIGMVPALFGVKKSLLMCALIAPTVLYLTGMSGVVTGMLGV